MAGPPQLKAEGRADSYVYALHARLSQLFSDAVHDGIVPRNPCSRRTSPGTGKQRPYVATTEQVWALYNAVPAGIRPAILLGAHAGLRLAEAAALRPEDVDFIRGVVSPAIQWPNEPLKSRHQQDAHPDPERTLPGALRDRRAGERADHRHCRGRTPHRRTLGHRASRTRCTIQGRGSPRRVPVPRPSALLRVATDRLRPRREGRAGAAEARLGEDHPRHLRTPLARQRRVLARRGRRGLRSPTTCGRRKGREWIGLRTSCGLVSPPTTSSCCFAVARTRVPSSCGRPRSWRRATPTAARVRVGCHSSRRAAPSTSWPCSNRSSGLTRSTAGCPGPRLPKSQCSCPRSERLIGPSCSGRLAEPVGRRKSCCNDVLDILGPVLDNPRYVPDRSRRR